MAKQNGNAKANGQRIRAAEPCATGAGCAETAKVAGYCSACYQGLRRLMKQNLAYLNLYLYRTGRCHSRGKAVLAEKRATRTKVA